MSRKHEESDTAGERRRMSPGMRFAAKWGTILGVLASIAICIDAMPTAGGYVSHVRQIWDAPDKLQRVEVLESNVNRQNLDIQTMRQNVQETHDDVRNIMLFLSTGKKPSLATTKTNSPYE